MYTFLDLESKLLEPNSSKFKNKEIEGSKIHSKMKNNLKKIIFPCTLFKF